MKNHIHLIGIGGSGLSAIAGVLLESGYTVSGSDRQLSPLAQDLQAAGARVFIGQRAENIAGADVVVRSSAVMDDNVEVQAARAAGIPVLKRADFLGQLMAGRLGIAIAGTHGKTTTTAMIAWVLHSLELDPSYIIGGVSLDLKGNAHAGQGPFFVIEADEYDRMFLGLQPQIIVVTNLEHDHPDCYPTLQDFYQAFWDFVGCLQPQGILVGCSDDPGAAHLCDQAAGAGRRVLRYGLEPESCDYWPENLVSQENAGFQFDLHHREKGRLAHVALQVPGLHNVSNALAVLAVADHLGLAVEQAAQALGVFRGTGRRFELRGEAGGVTVIDDYAHHPTEIQATLRAARARYPQRRIWVVWQPHTYSRLRTLFDDFVVAFAAPGVGAAAKTVDEVIVTEIYAAREAAPEDGFSARLVVDAYCQALAAQNGASEHGGPHMTFVPQLEQAAEYLLKHLQPGDILLVLSAGDANWISQQILEHYAKPGA